MQSAIKMVDLSLDIDAEEFYRMYVEYTSLKDCRCKTCTVCGSRRPVDKLNDAIDFLRRWKYQTIKLVFLMDCSLIPLVLRMKMEDLLKNASTSSMLKTGCTTSWILTRMNTRKSVRNTMVRMQLKIPLFH